MGILKRLESQQIVVFEDAVAVIKDAEGKIKLDQSMSLAGVGAVSGALWGTLIGLLFFAPFVGLGSVRRVARSVASSPTTEWATSSPRNSARRWGRIARRY